jgi:hypothetical protein
LVSVWQEIGGSIPVAIRACQTREFAARRLGQIAAGADGALPGDFSADRQKL